MPSLKKLNKISEIRTLLFEDRSLETHIFIIFFFWPYKSSKHLQRISHLPDYMQKLQATICAEKSGKYCRRR